MTIRFLSDAILAELTDYNLTIGVVTGRERIVLHNAEIERLRELLGPSALEQELRDLRATLESIATAPDGGTFEVARFFARKELDKWKREP